MSFSRHTFSHSRRSHTPLCVALLSGLLAIGATPAMAQSLSVQEHDEIVEQLEQLREQQARIIEVQKQLEARLGITDLPAAPASVPAIPAAPTPSAMDRLTVSGDLRLRGQHDRSDNDARDRSSAQVRARIGATYAVNDRVTIGGRLATGSAGDPNSTDVQLSNWLDDFDVSLDMAYAQLDFGDLKLYGGKFPQPFTRTDLVWDGDVNPQGVAATYKHALGNGGALRSNALLFVVNEDANRADSTMAGVQFGYDSPSHNGFKYDLSGAYYRYSLGSMVNADSGDWRTNRLKADGTYLSDYELVDVIFGGTWQGSNEKWPVRVVGDYVKNLGAVDGEDTGFGVDVSIGRASKPGDWRFTYGYAQTDVDAVMSAFSQDNIGIATNYKLHSLTVDYTPMPKTMISALWYHYKPNDPAFADANRPGDWLDRLRLFFLVNF